MERNKLKQGALMNLLLAGIVMQGQVSAPPMNYNTFIDQVRQEHPVAKKADNMVSIGLYQKKSASGLFDPQVNGNFDNKFFSGTNYYSSAYAELKQPIYTGQYLKAGYEYAQGTQLNPEEKTPVNGLPYVGVEVALLQGMMIDKRRYEVQKSTQYQKLFETESRIAVNDLMLNASEAYFTWLKDYTVAAINKRYLDASGERFKSLVTLSESGERPAVDTVEAAILYQTRAVDYSNAVIQLNKSYYGFYSYLWKNDSNVRVTGLSPADKLQDLSDACLRLFKEKDQATAIQNPGLQYYNYKSGVLNIERKYKAELVKPQLNVKYNLLGNAPSPSYTASSYYLNNYKWGAGFSMPLFLRTSTNDLKIARLNLKNNEYDLLNKSTELNNKMAAVKANLFALADQVKLAHKTLEYCQLLLDAEKLKFEHHESTLFLLNTRETKVLDAEIKYIEVQNKFILSYIYMVYLCGDMKYDL